MAKLRFYYPSSKAKRVKRLSVGVTLQAVHGGFEACASFGRGGQGNRTRKSQDDREACATAKNPRKAIGSALAKVGRNVGARGGAFAGFRRK